ncbi:MAG: hypothetical protein ABIH34_00330 [Nanoarchaeota archaeon]
MGVWMFGFKKKEETRGPFGDLDAPPAPPPLFEKHDQKPPFSPPPPLEQDELEHLPEPPYEPELLDPDEARPQKPKLPDFFDSQADVHIPSPDTASSLPGFGEPRVPSLPSDFSESPAERQVQVYIEPEHPIPPPRPSGGPIYVDIPRPPSPPKPLHQDHYLREPPQPMPRPPRGPLLNVEDVFAPESTVHKGQDIFVNAHDYKDILSHLSGVKANVKDCEDTLFKISELHTKKESELSRLHKAMEDVQRNFVKVDGKLFDR